MATIVAVDCADGVVLAGDRQVVRDGTVAGDRRRVFAFDACAAAAVGDDPDAFGRGLDVALREYSAERGEPGVDAVARMAAEIAEETGVEAIAVARDDDGEARARSVVDGTLEGPIAALGSAAEILLGRLDALGAVDVEEAEAAVRDAFRAAASRDPGTGDDLDVWRLYDADAGGGETV